MSVQQVSKSVESRTIAKVSWRLLPLVAVAYCIAYVDRSNISVAALSMNKDPGFHRLHLWLGRRHFLLQLFPVRNSEQSDPPARRRTALDRANHDHLGHHLRSHRLRHRTHQFPGRALYVGRRRSRFFPRHDPLLHLLVPGGISRPRDLDFVHRAAGRQCAGLDLLGRYPRHGWRAWLQGMAVDFHPRGDPCGCMCGRRDRRDDRPARSRRLADARRKEVAASQAR